MSSLQSAHRRHGLIVRPLHVAMLGARDEPVSDGVPGAVDEIAGRLTRQGHTVTVLGRHEDAVRRQPGVHPLSRAALASSRLLLGPRADVVLVLDPRDAPLIPMLRSRGSAVAVHVAPPDDPGCGQRWSRAAERIAVRSADAVITDTQVIQHHYMDEYAVPVELIRAGARIVLDSPADLLEPLGLAPRAFHLAATRGGDGGDVVLEGYHRSLARLPLVLAGTVTDDARRLARRDPRILVLGDVRDPRLLDQLHVHALTSLHGRAVTGSTRSLLRAMGAGTAVVAWNSLPNRETAGTGGSYFSSAAELTRNVEEVERYPFRFRDLGELMQERAGRFHDWDVAAEQYEALASKLSRGYSTRGMSAGRPVARISSDVAVEVRHG